MAFLDIFKRDKRKNPEYKFTEEDVERSHVSRQETLIKKKYNEIQMERLQHLQDLQNERHMQEKIAMMEEEIYGEEEGEEEEEEEKSQDPVDMLFGETMKMIFNKVNPGSAAPAAIAPQNANEEISKTISAIPEQNIKQLKALPVDQLTALIAQKYPQLTSDQVAFAISEIQKR